MLSDAKDVPNWFGINDALKHESHESHELPEMPYAPPEAPGCQIQIPVKFGEEPGTPCSTR